MASSNERTYVEMLPSASRMHATGGTLSLDHYQPPTITSDYRTNPGSSRMSLQNITLSTKARPDESYDVLQNQKVDDNNSSKKIFVDRQIKKVKSLSGLIKGTALTRQLPIHSTIADQHSDSAFLSDAMHHQEHAALTRQDSEQTSETRRPRVSFSDFDKIQYFDDHKPHYRHRGRSAKRTTNNLNYTSSVLAPHSETPNSFYYRQPEIPPGSNVEKQPVITSPRAYSSSRLTLLPDIVNHPSLPSEVSLPDAKHILHREKPLFHIPEPAIEIPMSCSTEVSRESARLGSVHPSVSQVFNEQNGKVEANDRGLRTSFSNSSLSSLYMNRQRPSLRTISLRQQFASPTRLRPSPSQQMPMNTRRSTSLNHTTARTQSSNNDGEEVNDAVLLSAFGHRPMTSLSSAKELKRNYIVHFDSKRSMNGYTSPSSSTLLTDMSETSPATRVQSALKLVRSPYSSTRTNTTEHVSTDFHPISNTIYV
ncbi:unnamed protein product [Adineta ricciae]|uniref:Uncharacterized protein n=1 Tax=Adineta ricciae TaxID=249248 RepID=A0A814QYB0_ADIRI|nr:unnamed protein product [Adineta ricciae]CAF1125869.1 unnamed protein product [Adineta ricciae]